MPLEPRTMIGDLAETIGRDGYAIILDALPTDETDRLITAVEMFRSHQPAGRRGGLRNLLAELPAVQALAKSPAVRRAVEAVLGPACFAVRGILFDKTPEANWMVIWHQDLNIAVQTERIVDGFGPWSKKAGVPHVIPPIPILEGMLALRVHLDDCGSDNGPLKVIPGSHRAGRLGTEGIEEWRRRVPAQESLVPRGGFLIMRPLLLHASSPASSPRHRRVVQLEYAAEPLPGGLEWHTQR